MSEDRRETGGLRLFIKVALLVGADALIGPKAFVLLCSCTERRCAERRDLSGGRDERDGQLMAEIF